MNAIIGFTRLLSYPEIPEHKRMAYAEFVHSSGKNLLNLINDIIDVAKIEAGQIQVKPAPTLPNKMLDELRITFNKQKIDRRKELVAIRSHKAEPDDDFCILTDPFRLHQILANLLGNALKFTHQGQIDFGYEILGQDIRFFVEDTGIGIPDDKLELIFERFGQVEDLRVDNREGTGLGLAISSQLARLLGGGIHVRSEMGKGSRFWFDLPLRRVPASEVPKAETFRKRSFNWEGVRVLVAEDNPLNQTLVMDTLLLFDKDLRVDIAEDGQKALEMARKNAYSIVLMDVRMPKMDGFQATRAIRETLPEPMRSVPILGLSAHALKEEKERCLQAGMDAYLTKPFMPEELFWKIDSLLAPDEVNRQLAEETPAVRDIEAAVAPPPQEFDWVARNKALLEVSFLKKIYQSNPQRLNELLNQTLRDIPRQMRKMREDLAQGQAKEVGVMAHALRTSFLYLGMADLRGLAGKLETSALGGQDPDELDDLLLDLEEAWEDQRDQFLPGPAEA